MLILTIRTDKPEAELGIFDNESELEYIIWQAHRQLSSTIHIKLAGLLNKNKLVLADLGGIVVFQGPGSFTGLRIGISLANALAYSLNVPIIGTDGDNWQSQGILRLVNGDSMKQVMPKYGSEPHTTQPRK
jgi:tRNA threonylcarbamoyladenosine biosynthesis protein TsaB